MAQSRVVVALWALTACEVCSSMYDSVKGRRVTCFDVLASRVSDSSVLTSCECCVAAIKGFRLHVRSLVTVWCWNVHFKWPRVIHSHCRVVSFTVWLCSSGAVWPFFCLRMLDDVDVAGFSNCYDY